ncbi:MAG: type VI secretion system tube protein Hcp [Vicinamibacterales bacterium]
MTTAPKGAVDMFLAVKGAARGKIAGESQDGGKHKGEMEILGWSWGMQARTAAGGGTAMVGRAVIRELKVLKKVDSASTALMGALRTNEPIKEAILSVRKFGSSALDYFVIKLEDARVASIDLEVNPKGDSADPFERVSFTFNRIEVTYVPQGSDGKSRGSMVFIDEFHSANE